MLCVVVAVRAVVCCCWARALSYVLCCFGVSACVCCYSDYVVVGIGRSWCDVPCYVYVVVSFVLVCLVGYSPGYGCLVLCVVVWCGIVDRVVHATASLLGLLCLVFALFICDACVMCVSVSVCV